MMGLALLPLQRAPTHLSVCESFWMTTDPSGLDFLPRMVFTMILFFGSILVFILPPIQGPDEDSHFVRIVTLASGTIYPTNEGGNLGQRIPQSLRDYVDAHKSLRFQPDQKYAYERWYSDSHAQAPKEPTVHFSHVAQLTSPLLYLPQIAGVLTGKLLYRLVPSPSIRFNWSAALYFARLGNLLAFAIGMAFALQFLPAFRGIVAFVATMPMSVFLASTVSYDITVNLSAIGFLCLMIAISSSGQPPPRSLKILAIVAAFFLGHAKIVYLPLLLAITLLRHVMPRRDFLSYAVLVFGAGVAGAVSALVFFGFQGEVTYPPVIIAQRDFLATHPFAIPSLLWRTLVTHSNFYFISFFGDFGWLDTNVPLPMIVLLFGLLLAAIAVDGMQSEPNAIRAIDRVVIFAASLACVILLALALYVTWTSRQPGGVGAGLVEGVMGRYFIPLAPFVACLFATMPDQVIRRAGWIRAAFPQIQMTAAAAMLAVTCFSVLARYWVPVPH